MNAMKTTQLSMIPAIIIATTCIRSTDNARDNNWVASGNWNQDPGFGDSPNEDQDDDQATLFYQIVEDPIL